MKRVSINLLLPFFFAIAFMLIWTGSSAASEDLLFRQRIEQLENDIMELKSLLKEQQTEQKKEKERVSKLSEKVNISGTSGAALTKKGFKFTPYGKIKLDMAYNDSRAHPGNRDFLFWAKPEANGSNADNEFGFTARETRLGFELTGPKYNGVEVKGVMEIDFYGADGDERKAEPMLRHAFMELKFPSFDLLAGQTWDVISPLNPSTCNYSVNWMMGNIGYRRPQVRVSKDFSTGESSGLSTSFALSLTGSQDLNIADVEDGKDSGFPSIQGRIGYHTNINGKKMEIGFSGHYGEEDVDTEYIGHEKNYKSWSANFDMVFPVLSSLIFKGEAFIGENLDTYLGGIGQGVNTATEEEIGSIGGWGQLTWIASKKLKFNIGAGIDDPESGDLNQGGRSSNKVYYGNLFYQIIPPVTLGLEYMHVNTDYKNSPDGDCNRFQTSLIYYF